MKKIINIQGKWYNLLGVYGGNCYLGKPIDIHNEVVKEGIIWEMQPFFHENQKWYSWAIKFFFKTLRFIKKFKNELYNC